MPRVFAQCTCPTEAHSLCARSPRHGSVLAMDVRRAHAAADLEMFRSAFTTLVEHLAAGGSVPRNWQVVPDGLTGAEEAKYLYSALHAALVSPITVWPQIGNLWVRFDEIMCGGHCSKIAWNQPPPPLASAWQLPLPESGPIGPEQW